ncbi:hypothetical protein [Longimicrobium sp.]|jgi:hypothetical protein|uniref:hypothetical protein n=1 Tax=Longimicrobium sp. TaxID=2029185 RepID=UPI002F956C0A
MRAAETAVRERPILFSDAMVRAILDGRKTQTRRVVRPQPIHRVVEGLGGVTAGMDPAMDGAIWYDADGINPGRAMLCPYGRIGNRLWVREAWGYRGSVWNSREPAVRSHRLAYRADGATAEIGRPADYLSGVPRQRAPIPGESEYDRNDYCARFLKAWRPSIHMPRWACRLVLEIVDVRVERVNDINMADATAEGAAPLCDIHPGVQHTACAGIIPAFRGLWDSINGARGYGWGAMPWVWAITFRRVEG